jgi:AAA15 family ATPase/GTPase
MAILEQLKIKNFRGFDTLDIDGFSKINLFVGKNNSGKTSILESLFLLIGMSNPLLPNNINQFRGLGSGSQFGTAKQLKYLFHNLSFINKPSFYAKFNDTSERWLELEVKYKENEFSENNSSISIPEINGIELNFSIKKKQAQKLSHKSSMIFKNNDNIITPTSPTDYQENLQAVFVAEKNDLVTLTRFSEIIKRKGGDSILQALKAFDENIENIQPLADGIFFNLKNVTELVPSNIMGDGIRRFLNIVTAVSEKQNSFVCIDEIENGLHYSAYKLLWKSLLAFSEQNNVQLFIATHNIETLACLKSVLEEKEHASMQNFAKVFTVSKTLKAGYKTYKYSFEGFKDAIERETEIRN